MTPATLRFLRDLCDRVTLAVADPEFKTYAAAMIAALDELDREITQCQQHSSTS